MIYENDANRDSFAAKGGLKLLQKLIMSDDHEVQEAALALMTNALLGHEKNCRYILASGVDKLIDLAERIGTETAAHKQVLNILEILGPYSYVECFHCGLRQPVGDVCTRCARDISFTLLEE